MKKKLRKEKKLIETEMTSRRTKRPRYLVINRESGSFFFSCPWQGSTTCPSHRPSGGRGSKKEKKKPILFQVEKKKGKVELGYNPPGPRKGEKASSFSEGRGRGGGIFPVAVLLPSLRDESQSFEIFQGERKKKRTGPAIGTVSTDEGKEEKEERIRSRPQAVAHAHGGQSQETKKKIPSVTRIASSRLEKRGKEARLPPGLAPGGGAAASICPHRKKRISPIP